MSTENRFNLIDEAWIPVVDAGSISLKQLFTPSAPYKALGGNPIQKIALTKLLLAIAQAAATPANNTEWQAMGAIGLANKCLEYLEKHHHLFWLYGDKPFLQMPAIQRAEIKSYGVVNAEISTGNTTIFSSSQIERNLSDSEKAILVPQLMGCALGGKKTDNSIVLSEGYLGKSNDKGKPSAGKPGPSVGFMGFLHSFLQGNTLIESIWLNLFTEETIRHLNMFPEGVGTPPWEAMPETENCAVASQLQHSYMGRLLPVSRFLLLKNDGLHYSEGVAYPSFKDGVFDPSITVNMQGKDPKAIWTDPERRPWRYLTSLLSFLTENTPNNFECWQLKQGMQRARTATASIGIWCGGLRVSSNAGEQYASGQDDYVESAFKISCDHLGQQWFDTFNHEMARLEEVAKTVYGATSKYFAEQKVEGAKYASLASGLFWQLSEERAQDLIDACATPDASKSLRQSFANIALQAFDATCPQGTSRQIDIWAKTRPNLRKYLEL